LPRLLTPPRTRDRESIKSILSTNPPYKQAFNIEKGIKSIKKFSKSEFKKLEIIEFTDGEKEAYVEFKAYIDDYVMHEKSFFLKEDKWYYVGEA